MDEFFKVLADETRLRCLAIIFTHKEVCVCELIHALGLPQSKISRHLSIMKLNNIISQRKEGQWAFYSMHPELSAFKQKVISLIIQEQNTIRLFQADNKKLASMNNRPVIADR